MNQQPARLLKGGRFCPLNHLPLKSTRARPFTAHPARRHVLSTQAVQQNNSREYDNTWLMGSLDDNTYAESSLDALKEKSRVYERTVSLKIRLWTIKSHCTYTSLSRGVVFIIMWLHRPTLLLKQQKFPNKTFLSSLALLHNINNTSQIPL